MTRSANNSIDNNNNTPLKPKRPLSAYNLFYRYKRAKISDAYKSGDNSKDTIVRLTECTPGLEGYNAAVETYTSTQLMELSRGNVRAALLDNLAPKDNSKRAHRKNPNSTMSFLEMNRIMTASWKSLDDNSRGVFEELSDEGKRLYRKRLAEFEEMYPEESKSSSPRPSKKAKLSSSTTPKMKKNSKTLARVVSDVGSSVGSPKSTMSYMTHQYGVVGTPINTATAARRFVTPDASKHILPPPITRPDEPVSSMSYFDCLDIDLSDEAVHPLDTTEDFTDIFDPPVEEGGDTPMMNHMSMGMMNHNLGMMDTFPQLPFTSTPTAPKPTGEEEAKKLYGYEVQPNPQVDDFLELISSMDDANLSFAALAA